MERSLGKQKWKGISEIYTNELSVSMPGKITMPMIIEGKTFVLFDKFENFTQ